MKIRILMKKAFESLACLLHQMFAFGATNVENPVCGGLAATSRPFGRRFCHSGAMFGVVLLFGVSYAIADEPVQLPEQVVHAEPLFTKPNVSESLGLSIPVLQTPLHASVMNASFIKAQGSQTLRDVLRNSVGINTGTGNGIHDFFVIRGVDSLNGGLVLVDGIPEPEAIVYPLSLFEEVHVLKGPGAFAYGANSLAGSVNLIRKSPQFDRFLAAEFTAGSHDTYRGVIDAAGYAEDRAAGRIVGLYEEEESYRDGIEREIFNVSPSMMVRLSEDSEISIFFDYMKSELTPDAGVPVLGDTLVVPSRSATYHLPDDESDQEVNHVVADYRHRLSELQEIRGRFYFTQLDWQSDGTILGSFPFFLAGLEPTPRTLGRLHGILDDEQRVLGGALEWSSRCESGGCAHEAVLGIEAQRFNDDFVIDINPASSIDIVTYTESPVVFPDLPPNTGDSASDIFSAYLRDRIVISEQWSLLAGARLDQLKFGDDDRGTSRSDIEFNPFGGVVYQPMKPIALYVNGGTGFAPPSTQVLGPRGEPETSIQVEAGVKVLMPDPDWFAQVAVYHLERDDIAIPESSGLFTRNGSQESKGVEVEVQGRITAGIRLFAVYAYLDSELTDFTEMVGPSVVDRSGNTAPFAPEHIARVWSSLDLTENFGVALGLRAVGDQFIAADNMFEIESYTTLDAAMFYSGTDWYISVHAENLTDEDFATRGTGNLSVIPADYLSVFGTVGIIL